VFAEMLDAVASGKIDAMVDDMPAFGGVLERGGFRLAHVAPTQNAWGAACRLGDDETVSAIDRGLARHADRLPDPLAIAAALGGRELAAIMGAALAARQRRIPALLDGFVCTAAVAPLAKLRRDALDHTLAAHVAAEAAHRMLLSELELAPLLDLGMRLGEGSGAALAVPVLRAALACHTGMATFAQAGVANKSH